jgi:hypothetical protein
MTRVLVLRIAMAVALLVAQVAAAEPVGPESKRLARAKDYVNEERWPQAVDELRAAIADSKETRKDEALYWLAHSLNQLGDRAASVETISRLEREYPSSMWVKPARALRIEIAVRLGRSDVLWYAAMPPSPPAAIVVPKGPAKARPDKSSEPKAAHPGAGPAKLPAPPLWYADSYSSDANSQILALSALMKIDSERAIPLLMNYAFENDPGLASRAVLVLAQSELPKAVDSVVKIAKTGSEPAKITAVRALGRVGPPKVSTELLQVYDTAGYSLKLQVVRSLGERADKGALTQIVRLEKNPMLRYVAIEGLGQAGAVDQLFTMYKTAAILERSAIITGLFNARADAELIQICDVERKGGNPKLASDVVDRLRLLSTPKAKEYLLKVSEKR